MKSCLLATVWQRFAACFFLFICCQVIAHVLSLVVFIMSLHVQLCWVLLMRRTSGALPKQMHVIAGMSMSNVLVA